jgi:hypothetical protein
MLLQQHVATINELTLRLQQPIVASKGEALSDPFGTFSAYPTGLEEEDFHMGEFLPEISAAPQFDSFAEFAMSPPPPPAPAVTSPPPASLDDLFGVSSPSSSVSSLATSTASSTSDSLGFFSPASAQLYSPPPPPAAAPPAPSAAHSPVTVARGGAISYRAP